MADGAPSLRQLMDARLTSLDQQRLSWFNHWRELAEYILPRRYRWLVMPNELSRGNPINGKILDSTGTIAARTLASGMMSGITSPTRPWFKLNIEGVDQEETSPISLWLAECEKRMMRVFSESNFYNSVATLFTDLSVFNTAPMLIYEDYEDVIRCYNPCAGEYYLANGARMDVNVFYRKFTRTVAQCVEEWGIENVGESISRMYKAGGAQLQTEVVVAHGIEPNTEPREGVPQSFPFRECYWEWGSANGGDKDKFFAKRGFHEMPGVFPRWDIVANDVYGNGPSMDALGDIKQLQQETKRKAQALDKMVNPPLLADLQLKNQPASTIPGGVTYVAGLANSVGMKPIYTVMPPVQEIMMDIQQVQERIRTVLYNPLFLAITSLQTVRSAEEVAARRQEQLTQLGPVIERFQNEALNPIIDRVFNIMNRTRLLPPAPADIQGMPIKVTYVSMLAEAQRSVATTGIERLLTLTGSLSAVFPTIGDKINSDQVVDEYADLLSVSPKLVRSDQEVEAMRMERAKKEQQIQQLQVTDAAVGAAKTLSETEVGGGQNALQRMMQ